MHSRRSEEIALLAIPIVDVRARVDKNRLTIDDKLNAKRISMSVGSKRPKAKRTMVEGKHNPSIGRAHDSHATLLEGLDASRLVEGKGANGLECAFLEQPAELLVRVAIIRPALNVRDFEGNKGEHVAEIERLFNTRVEDDPLVVVAELDANGVANATGGCIMRHGA